jgi:hypothetical protein
MDGLGGRRSEKRRGYFGRIGLKELCGREKNCPFRRVWRNPRVERSKLVEVLALLQTQLPLHHGRKTQAKIFHV